MIKIIVNLLKSIGVNKAVFFGALTRGWAAFAGVITVFLVAFFFSPELQGYYFTFNSLLALQIFVELGLCAVIIYFASHEWAKLGFDENGNVIGDESAISRLRSLAKVSFLWYFIGGLILIVGLSLAGYLFFSSSGQHGINWRAPWFALCFFTGISMWLLPAFSLLEGSNQVAQVYFYRLIQAIFRSISTWTIIALGGALWATVGAVFFPLFWTIYYPIKKYSNYFKAIFKRIPGPRLDWKSDIWPMQWRIAVSWLSNYFSFYVFTPVLFYFQGPVVAGQMGMTWSIVNALSLIAAVWIFARAPEFGILIAKKEYHDLDKLLFRSGAAAVGIACLGSIVIFAFVSLIYTIGHPLSLRFLPPLPTLFFLLATILMQISFAQGNYLRAHKKEPFMGLSVAAAVMIFILVIATAAKWGAIGITASYLFVVALFIIPYGSLIWHRCRKEWHSDQFDDEFMVEEEKSIRFNQS
ncbi:MAG: hypothetical protein KKA31_03430 [Candidatus Margulisbacteria bacterium]|nr:hypothetical protein [Candidatus Margulisiibacteriota bacterium]